MHTSWLSLMPPLVVIVVASFTQKLNPSLLLGLAIATLIATDGNPVSAGALLLERCYKQIVDFESACNYLFLFIISTLIVLISRTGGAIAFAHAITKRLRSARMVETASLLVSSTLFIDDYLSNLTTGYVMRAPSDRFAIPRVKLAYLVHALGSPLVILSPVSSWVAVLTGQIEKAEISTTITAHTKIIAEPFVTYVQAIPFMFYSLILIISAWFVVRARISFGPMHTHEKIAQETGNLFGGKQSPANAIKIQEIPHATAQDLVIPVLLLIGSVFGGFLYAGGYYMLGGTRSLLQALQHNTQTALVLLIAGITTLIISTLIALVRKTFTAQEIPALVKDGIIFIYSAVLMIFLATVLGEVLKTDLRTGVYMASLLEGTLALWLLPTILFLISTVISFVTGSTWGTIALMSPIGTQMLTTLTPGTIPYYPADIPMLLPVIGGIFAGAICGNHISPISDTTIMASTSCGTYPIDHVYTQLPYVIPVIVSSIIAFLCAGFLAPYGSLLAASTSLGVGIVCCLGSLSVLNKVYKV